MINKENTVEFPLERQLESRFFSIQPEPPQVICGECYKKGKDDVLMSCPHWRIDSQEYCHETIIAQYRCDQGHAFRLVTFL
jgi:hypothetical protein